MAEAESFFMTYYHQRFTCVRLTARVDLPYRCHSHHHDYRHQTVHAILLPGRKTKVSITVTVGHTVSFALTYLDQHGNPMLATPVPDAAPVWSNTTPATGTLTAAGSGNTASESALAVGTDTVSVSLAVGGKTFTASADLTVAPEPQVLTSVALAATVS